MEAHYQLSDSDFAHQFETLTLTPQWFTHEAHLRLAWIHLKSGSLAEAEEKICQQIQIFDCTFDDGTKFHKTLTIAAVNGVNHFLQQSKSDNFQDFMVEFPDLKHRFKDLLATHYSWNIFEDEQAKVEFVAPDLDKF
ncbi:MAG: hypothetical protein AAGG68_09265 [Bacteroidota bacterium]